MIVFLGHGVCNSVRVFFPLLGLVVACPGLHACAEGKAVADTGDLQPPAHRALATTQLIIKFRAAELDPTRPAYLESLYRNTGVRLKYLRAMSGDVHVFSLFEPVDAAALKSVLERLRKHSDIQYAEPDRRVRHMEQ